MKFKIGDIVQWSEVLWQFTDIKYNFRVSGVRGNVMTGAMRIYEIVPINDEDNRYNYYDAMEEELFLVQEPNDILKDIL